MKKQLVLFSFFLPFAIQAQNIDKWRAGSAKTLTGKIYTLSCFVSGPGSEWTYNEKVEMLDSVKACQAWLKNQALKYNVNVDFEQSGNFGLDKDIKLASIERGTASGNESVDWVAKVFGKLGYKTPLDFDGWIKSNTTANNYNVIIFVKGEGNGYAMAYSTDMASLKDKFYVEGSVLYEQYNGGGKLASSSIAHETLHVYAAWDLYQTFSQSASNEQRAKELFPNSVMLRTAYDINELEIDPLTAWLIGWNKYPEKWYESFRPKE